jgi:anthranilate phosphoribosyltransferase
MAGIKEYIEKVVHFKNLTEDEASRVFQIIMNDGAVPAEVAAFLIGLKMKGETIDEIVGGAKVLRMKAGKINAPDGTLDTCGTGGKVLRLQKDAVNATDDDAEKIYTFNISTTVAFVLAACGVPVAKHGNRAVSSLSGSADVLKELGVNIDADPKLMERVLNEIGICFMMAPKFHTAMRHVAPVRKDISVRTIFNILGPLSNPADAKYQLLGVYDKKLVEPLAHVLGHLGVLRAWVVHGEDGMDELTTTGKSFVAELKDGKVTTFEVHPEELGLELVGLEQLRGGNAMVNAQHMRAVLKGGGDKYYRDIVLLNAAASLVVVGKVEDLQAGIAMAAEVLDSGKANDILQGLVAISNEDV